jgi:arylsulfatase A-like enzyme
MNLARLAHPTSTWLAAAAACWLLAVPLPGRAGDPPPTTPAPRPNILFIALDDLNHWVGYTGRNPQTKTPHIDRLAARGVRFTHAYCAAPVCNPSRTALLSGQRPSTTGVYDNHQDFRPVVPVDQTLISTFRKAGYLTLGSGKIYHEAYARRSEWDDYLADEGKDPKPTGNDGVGGIKFAPLDCKDEDLREWNIVQYGIDQLGKDHGSQPFLLTVGLHKPHMPWNVPRKYYDMHPLDSIELPPHRDGDLADVPAGGIKFAKPQGDHKTMLESGRWKEAVQGYLAAVSYADAMVGRLMDAFDRSPYRDNTIVVLWGDHGWHLGEKEHWRKFALWEEATRAPLIWVVPGLTKPDQLCTRTVDFMSIYPTLTDLAGIARPAHVEGLSIRPLLADPQAEWATPALTTYRFNNHAVRSEGWRYIRYADGGEELYDEAADPYEWTNLASDPTRADLKTTLSRTFPKTNAPERPGVNEGSPAAPKAKAKAKARAKARAGADDQD